MKLFSALTGACVMVCATLAAAEKPVDTKVAEQFLGKWEATDSDMKGSIFEFTKSGELKLNIKLDTGKFEMTGKYKVPAEDTLEVTIKNPDGKEQVEKLKYKFDKDSLSITGTDNKTIKFAKAK